MNSHSRELSHAFLNFALESQVLRFGRFTTKAGRESPYFFDAGLFNTGAKLEALGRFYAETIQNHTLNYSMLFGPAYKGIALATTTASALSRYYGLDIPIAFNRKEAKDHGEGGQMIGSPLTGRVLVVDDVISAGTSVGESANWIKAAKAELSGVIVALDRQERSGSDSRSAVQQVEDTYGVPVIAIARLDDLVHLLAGDAEHRGHLPAILEYRKQYGVD
ncbi:MAG: orotate phosphoribosyltransferase [Magnetococcales bacterium]|nr:orotate phosphoribosyltransferase [Magnetococcales bacterium]